MRNGASTKIGFSQPVELSWLEHTAFLLASGQQPESIRSSLDELLSQKIPAPNKCSHGSRYKRISILMRIWAIVPPELHPFRNTALALIRHTPSREHLPLHYGMTIVAYPFFAAVAESIGRLVKLQEAFTTKQLQRRVSEALGQRETVKYAATRVVRSLVDWGCLRQAEPSGNYELARQSTIHDPEVTRWLLESVLLARDQDSIALDQAQSDPVLFPFIIPAMREAISHPHRRLSITQHGLDAELISRTN